MDELFAAIAALWNGKTAELSLPPIYYGHAPQGVMMPYAVFRLVSCSPDVLCTDCTGYVARVSFSMWAGEFDTPANVMQISSAARSVLDSAVLHMENWVNVKTSFVEERLDEDPFGGFVCVSDYKFVIQPVGG